MLREAVSAMNLNLLAEIGLGIFILVFIAITLRVLLAKKSEMDYAANLPNQDN